MFVCGSSGGSSELRGLCSSNNAGTCHSGVVVVGGAACSMGDIVRCAAVSNSRSAGDAENFSGMFFVW